MPSHILSWSTLFAKLGLRRTKRKSRSLTNYRPKLRFEQFEDRRMLAVFTVNDPGDFIDSNPNVTTLREAIDIANQDAIPDMIEFASNLNGATIMLTQGELSITELVTIDAADANGIPRGLTIDAGGGTDGVVGNGDGFRIFNIFNISSGNVELNSLTLTGGDMDGVGGAILATGNLSVKHTVITGNASVGGGGIFAQFALAG